MTDGWIELLDSLTVPSPLRKVNYSSLNGNSVSFYIKREDLIHPYISGNKWRKLKYNLLEVIKTGQSIVSFGGAFSNHIFALAAASKHLSIPTVLYIRGEITDLNNPTLDYCRHAGVKLIPLSREDYRKKNDPIFLTKLLANTNNYCIIPEGGSNAKAYDGLKELATEINDYPLSFDYVTVSAGTGMTAACMGDYIDGQVVVYPALKGTFVKQEIESYQTKNKEFTIRGEYHFGGYGKSNKELTDFINHFYSQTGISLDPIYTGKMLYGVIRDIETRYYTEEAKILVVHTGGLQGIDAYNYRWKGKYGYLDQ